jgi:hypothetical protein
MTTVTCKRCTVPKHPQMFSPSDLKNRTNVCRSCRRNAQPGKSGLIEVNYWRHSMHGFFTDGIAKGRAH